MATKSVDQDVSIAAAAIPSLRKAIILGMVATGEIERLQTLASLAALGGNPWPEEQRAIHPAGGEVLADFADALYWLETVTEVAQA